MILLGRRFNGSKWRALFLLVLGLILVCDGSYVPSGSENTVLNVQYVIGVAADLAQVCLAGFVARGKCISAV